MSNVGSNNLHPRFKSAFNKLKLINLIKAAENDLNIKLKPEILVFKLRGKCS